MWKTHKSAIMIIRTFLTVETKCRVAVWSHYGGVGSLPRFIRVGSSDEAWNIQPDVHIVTQSKSSIFELDGTIPEYTEFYTRRDVWRKESDEMGDQIMLESPDSKVQAG